MILMVNPSNEDDLARAKEATGTIVTRALDMGGTCTGENISC